MSENEQGAIYFCEHCEERVAVDSEFCPFCGTLFTVGHACANHGDVDVSGVCVICCRPYCSACGERINGIFLCVDHAEYEIYQGRARVYGTSDAQFAEYVKEILEQENLHPFLYVRKATPYSIGAGDYTLFRASGEFNGHLINEIKVMVPCPEVLEAERVLQELDV